MSAGEILLAIYGAGALFFAGWVGYDSTKEDQGFDILLRIVLLVSVWPLLMAAAFGVALRDTLPTNPPHDTPNK